MLSVTGLRTGYDKIEVLHGIDLQVSAGKIVSLIGSNGAGKSSFLMALSGLLRAWNGQVEFNGQAIHGLAPDAIVRAGLVQVPEGRRIFAHLTVEENLDLGAYTRHDPPGIRQDKEEMFKLFPILKQRLRGLAGNLSGGEQQMLAMARALMARPKLLCLDEPSLGLAPMLVEKIFEIILGIKARGLTILLVEQNAFKALEIADWAYVLENGKIELQGTGLQLLLEPKVKSAYLGV